MCRAEKGHWLADFVSTVGHLDILISMFSNRTESPVADTVVEFAQKLTNHFKELNDHAFKPKSKWAW